MKIMTGDEARAALKYFKELLVSGLPPVRPRDVGWTDVGLGNLLVSMLWDVTWRMRP